MTDADATPAPVDTIDAGLLSPLTIGADAVVTDGAVLRAMVTAEVALTRAWVAVGAPAAAGDAVSARFGWIDAGSLCAVDDDLLAAVLAGSAAGGNPVIPLATQLRARVDEPHRAWVHRGATSQDVVDTALMLTARRAIAGILTDLDAVTSALDALARTHRDDLAIARTLGQHAVPTTIGLRIATWTTGIARAAARLRRLDAELPAQLGGAAGTLAALRETAVALGVDDPDAVTVALPAVFAEQLALAAPVAPWHTQRWPVTEVGDALVAVTDALGVVATDVATLSRTEIGELAEGATGGSSAMPQKRNPATSVLIRSGAIRAPHLAATLHTAAALAADERPDGAWHTEWPALRELLRIGLGAAAAAARLADGLRIDSVRAAGNVALTGGLALSERIAAVVGPVLGAARTAALISSAADGDDLRDALAAAGIAGADIDDLLDPTRYVGIAPELVDRLLAGRAEPAHRAAPDHREEGTAP